MNTPGLPPADDWRTFVRRHWRAVTAFVVCVILVASWALWVFLWFAGFAQSSGLVPQRLGLWTMASLLNFILNGVFWGLVLVGLPVVGVAVAGWAWWRRMPFEERRGYRMGGRGRSAGGGGGIGLLLFIAFVIKVYLDGNWDVPLGTYTVDYVVGSLVTILIWSAVILGVPAAIALVWWIRRETTRAPASTPP